MSRQLPLAPAHFRGRTGELQVHPCTEGSGEAGQLAEVPQDSRQVLGHARRLLVLIELR